MRIFIDQDNVLNQFIRQCALYVHKLYDIEMTFTPDNCKSWGIFEEMFPYASKDSTDRIGEEVFSTPGFWSTMDMQNGAADAMMRLIHDGHEVYIATMPWPTARNCIPEKIAWVEKNLPFFN